MNLRNLVEELGRRLNTPLALDGGGLARIIVDQSLPVDFELDEPHGLLLVYSVIGILPAGAARERFFERLLSGNLFGAQMAPCSPAFDPERNEMLLWFSLGESAHIEGAVDALEKLVALAETWRNELTQVHVGGDTVAAGEPAAYEPPAAFNAFMRA
ncbi:MAG TPA: type III secretion system chaperone [Steroidobacteraceae bacterium]|nr:type III secretion system chaperone [Steroidobacteraceae bacterium]